MSERPEINAVIEHYGGRTQNRTSYMTSCVFHEDQTPSMSVNTERQLFNCKSCGEKGDSYTLIMKKEDIPKNEFRRATEVAASLGFAVGDAGGGDAELRGSTYGGRRQVVDRKRSHGGNGGYVPRWRRD